MLLKSFCLFLVLSTVKSAPFGDKNNLNSVIESNEDKLDLETIFTSKLHPSPVGSGESSRSEEEGFNSKVLTHYEKSQDFIAKFISAEPIVDNIKEEDKYGNSGDKFLPIGKFLVDGFEAFSNLLNKFIDVSFNCLNYLPLLIDFFCIILSGPRYHCQKSKQENK